MGTAVANDGFDRGTGLMTPVRAILSGLSRSLTVAGRASRTEFWWTWGFHIAAPSLLILVAAPALAGLSADLAAALFWAGLLTYLLTFPAVLTGMIRRAHDIGRRGWLPGLLYALVIGLAIWAVGIFLSEASFAVTSELARGAGLAENPAMIFAIGPSLLVTAIIDGVLIGILLIALVVTFGPLVLIALVILIAGLARPSEPTANRYGPVPPEVAP